MAPQRSTTAASTDAFIEAFEDAWSAGRPPALDDHLPPTSEPALRRAVLEELIKVDINWRWSAPSRGITGVPLVSLEQYCKQFPELGGLGGVPDEIIAEDYRAMQRWGSPPDRAGYLSRFGERATQLDGVLRRIDVELAREFAAPPRLARPVPMAVPIATAPLLPLRDFLGQLRALELVEPPALDAVLRDGSLASADAHAVGRALIARDCLTPYQVNLLLRGRGHELVIGQYVLLDRLGQGGMGKVFKAIHRGMRRLVALKVIRPDLMLDEEVVNRFYREIRVVGQFSHHNIVHAYDAGPIGMMHALAMEYVEGIDLARRVKRSGPLPLAEACDFVRQAAEGLQYAFERGLVHRDIKPHNLLLAGSGVISPVASPVVKILDFGLARLQQADPSAGSTSMVTPTRAALIGTPDFLAPEQAVDFHAADARSDIYSLGCTLFYLLTGDVPFPGGTMAEKLLRHQMAEPPDLAARINVPAPLGELVRQMIAKQPAERPQTPGEVAAALAAFAPPSLVAAIRATPSPAAASMPPIPDTVVDELTPFSDFESCEVPAPLEPRRPDPSVKYAIRLCLGALAALVLVALVVLPLWLLTASRRDRSAGSATKDHPAVRPEAVATDPFFRDLVGYWRMDEGQGNHIADSSGRGNHAVLHQAGWTSGVRGRGVAFHGDESYLSYDASPDFDFAANAPFTIALWFKTTAPDGFIVSQRRSESDAADIDIGLAGGALSVIVRTDQYLGGYVRSAAAVNDNRWHHVALTRTAGDEIHLYLDGILEGSNSTPGIGGPITTNLRAAGSERLWVQIRYNGQPQYRGSIDEFCIFRRELSEPDVKELMRRTAR